MRPREETRTVNIVGVNFKANTSLSARYEEFLMQNTETDPDTFQFVGPDCILTATAGGGSVDPLLTLKKLSQRNGFSRCSGKLLAARFLSSSDLEFYSRVEPLLQQENIQVRVHCYPFSLTTTLLDQLDLMKASGGIRATVTPTNPTHLLLAARLPGELNHRYCWGFYTAEEYKEYIARPGDGHRDPVFELNFNRAQLKLAEAFQLLTQEENQFLFKDGEDIFAVDVGAAPGGWTGFLAGLQTSHKRIFVVAIDPAQLSSDITQLDNVHHLQNKAEDVVDCPELGDVLLSQHGQAVAGRDWRQKYRLLTCDANLDVRDCVRELVLPLCSSLAPGGLLILTLKLGRRVGVEGVARKLDSARALLEEGGFSTLSYRTAWLFANSKNERTIIARRF